MIAIAAQRSKEIAAGDARTLGAASAFARLRRLRAGQGDALITIALALCPRTRDES
jgi:hypothetical protein